MANPFAFTGSPATSARLGASALPGFNTFNQGLTAPGGIVNTTTPAAAQSMPFPSFNTPGVLNTQKSSGFPGFGRNVYGMGTDFLGAPTQGELFGLQAQLQQGQPIQLNQLITALSAPTFLGDERDAILAKWNQLQACWGTGKGYANTHAPPVDFTLENPFCKFKTVGYSRIPTSKDEDGLVLLTLNQKEVDVRSQLKGLVESLHKVLGGQHTLSVNVEGVKALPDDQTEVIIYVVERFPLGIARRLPVTRLFSCLTHVEDKLKELGVVMCSPRSGPSPAQLKQQNAPPGMDSRIWEQAQAGNPNPEYFIAVPMEGFKELLHRMKIQDQMTKQHQIRLDIMSNDIGDLQKNQVATVSKIAQYKKRLMDLSHRVLQVLIKQEIQRKSGCAIDTDEEHLSVQLDTIDSELNAPTKMKGRLNELMAQIRMQNQFRAVRSEECYSVDAGFLSNIKELLKQQQEGISRLIEIIRDDLEDIKTIEWLNENAHMPRLMPNL